MRCNGALAAPCKLESRPSCQEWPPALGFLLPEVALSSLSWAFPGSAVLPSLGPCPPSRLDDIIPLHRTAVVLPPGAGLPWAAPASAWGWPPASCPQAWQL